MKNGPAEAEACKALQHEMDTQTVGPSPVDRGIETVGPQRLPLLLMRKRMEPMSAATEERKTERRLADLARKEAQATQRNTK